LLKKAENRIVKLETETGEKFEVPGNPVDFCPIIGFTATKYQEKLLLDEAQFVVARWCRQSGKSHAISAKLLWECLHNPGFNVVVVAPSLRQSKIVIRKVSAFLRYLPKSVCPKPLKTKLEFYNGSQIQAFPNKPETIRGEPGVHLVYIDEFNYVPDDSDIYDAVVYTLSTTNGKFIATSTPGSRDSIFYHMCDPADEAYSDVSRHHISFEDALEPNGPLKRPILEKLRRQIMATDPWRWSREMLAEFAEDEDAWFPMSLITSAIDQNLEPRNPIPFLTNR
jgi:phage FluMu gp28-like protein